MKVGFIGLGIMGQRMAANLQKGGYDLIVYNRTKSSAKSLVEGGAVLADHPDEVGAQADVLFTVLSAPHIVKQFALGENGFLPKMRKGTIWVDSTTVNPSFSRMMADEAKKLGIRFLGAPVAGTKGPADRGELTFLVGGDESDLKEVQPLLDKMGKKTIFVGGPGMGTALKMVFNLLLGVNMLAFAEALTMGEALGISKEMVFDSLQNSGLAAPFIFNKRSKIESGNYEADFSLQWLQKDLQLASITGYENNVPMPSVNVAKEVYALAKNQGLGEEDFSAIYQFLSSKNSSNGSEE